MVLLQVVLAVFVNIMECKERRAGLVVLPPLIIGYDEFNIEDSEEDDLTNMMYNAEDSNELIPDARRNVDEDDSNNLDANYNTQYGRIKRI